MSAAVTFNATAEQLATLDSSELCAHVAAFVEAMDPTHVLNKIHARTIAEVLVSKLDPRTQAGEATDERDSRIMNLGDALEALVTWATRW